MIQHITSRDNPLIQRLRKLAQDPTSYRKLGQIWLEGDHLVDAALRRGLPLVNAVVAESAWLGEAGSAMAGDSQAERLSQLAEAANKVTVVPDQLFKQFTGLESPVRLGGLIDLGTTQPTAGSLQSDQPTVVLDRLQDAGNVGTILRSASALGVRQVIALKGTAAIWSPKVLRAAMGAHFGLRLVEQASVEDLDKLGMPLVATSSHADHMLHEAPLPTCFAWVMGHEGQGVSEALMSMCAMTVSIPQPGGEESLNVGVAASICFYESLRRTL